MGHGARQHGIFSTPSWSEQFFLVFIMGGNGEIEIFKGRLQLNYKVLNRKPVPLYEESGILYCILATLFVASTINIFKMIRNILHPGRCVR